MKTFKVGPALAAIAVFLVLANALLIFSLGGYQPEAGEPQQEIWLVYYAFNFRDEPPDSIDQSGFRRILEDLHPDARHVAKRFKVISYSRNGRHFELLLQHENGTQFRVSLGGPTVAHG